MAVYQTELCEITEDNLIDVLRLSVHETQKRLVASNAASIAQGHYSDLAWFRAIYAGGEAVGFVMLSEDEAKPEYFLWRFMIDVRHQGRGLGRDALLQVIERVRQKPGASCLMTSVIPREGNARRFYEKLGFEATGEVEEGEELLRLAF
ncbi:MAG: GNAT family N-acetyltransferase [Planctomycetota bacterium]